MRIGYITCVIYNTPDNLRIALEDNLIENSANMSVWLECVVRALRCTCNQRATLYIIIIIIVY